MAIKKLFLATVQVAVDAEACGGTVAGACDYFSAMLSENEDVFDWRHGTEPGAYPEPSEVEVDEETYEEGDLFS